MRLVKRLLGESDATAFKPERIDAFVEEFNNGKRILVLTATSAELVQSREDLRQFTGPYAAFSLENVIGVNRQSKKQSPVKIGGNTYQSFLTQDAVDSRVTQEGFTSEELADTEFVQERIKVWEDNEL